ncbi:unnamed protein product [Caenorhabditis angaria]|uniref:Uncharacterized protein n=1 Tax=Caenorhabditis angaria TaxID=860376 RepID=A0A9P1IB84_9PELO|nr:unnamed protein product [Caenorhabditis angaria]
MSSFYPTSSVVDSLNFKILCEMAEKYKSSSLHRKIEKFLCETSEISLIEKIRIGDENGYEELLRTCMQNFEDKEDLENFQKSKLFSDLKESSKIIVINRLFDFL